MSVDIVYAQETYLGSFHQALGTVARERIFIEMVEPPPLKDVAAFQRELMFKNAPIYYAIDEDQVVGWCDVTPKQNPRQSHRGSLGMGCLPNYRGQGIGSRLLATVLKHAKSCGLEKVELYVYTSNIAAIQLYKKFGFEQEGLIRSYRRLDGQDFDCLAMSVFLKLQASGQITK